MFSVRCLVERLRLFQRNRVPLNLEVLGLAIYFQTSSFRRTARVLSGFCRFSGTAVWKWVVKLGERLMVSVEEKPRQFTALD
jgi:hypothetical protein